MRLKCAWYWLLAGVVTIFLPACTGISSDSNELFTVVENTSAPADRNEVVPGYFAGVVPWAVDEGDMVVPVSVVPDGELQPGDGKMTMSVMHVPFVEPDGAIAYKGTSALVDGGDFYLADNVTESEVQGYTFDPSGGPAYACFELKLDGEAPYTMGLAWYSLPADMNSYYVGIGDRARQTWHWYYGPGDGVLTFDPTTWPGGTMGDSMLVCILLEAGLPADFQQLKSGVTEMRGTGLIMDELEMRKAGEKQPSVSKGTSTLAWPTKVDLRPFAAPMGNQGSIGSCTAFAVANGALNITLNRMYYTYGWDINSAVNQASPMWCYVKSGISPYGNFNPPCGASVGRYMSQPFNLLKNDGCATAETVPYIATANCSTTFPQLAYTEGELLTIHSWDTMATTGLVDSIKEQLAVYERPVPIAMYGLENSFLYYSSGVYHYGGTQGVSGGHAMCIIGYDDDLQAFDVRNSWGSGWGDGGYWWCGYDAVGDLASLGRFSGYAMAATENPAAVEYFLESEVVEDYDEVEPNDSLNEANELPEFFFTDYHAQAPEGDLLDVYRFEYEAASNTTVTVTYNPVQYRLRVTLVDTAGNTLATATGDDGIRTISGVWNADGVAYIVIQPEFGTGNYEISGTATIPPASPQNFIAADGTEDTGIALSWDAVDGAQVYTVQRALDQSGPWTQLTSVYEPGHIDFSGRMWTEYWYRVMAVNNDGSSLPTAAASAVLIVAAPSGVTASDGEYADQIVVSWDAVEGAEGYMLMRGPTADGPFVVIGEFATGPATDTQVVENMVYHYVVCSGSNGHTGPASTPDTGQAGSGLEVDADLEAVDTSEQQIEVTEPGGIENPEGGRIHVTR